MTTVQSDAVERVHRVVCAGVACWLLAVVGCSAEPTPHGIVRFDDGQPVQSGSIEFRSLSSGDRYASRISSDGQFTLSDPDGEAVLPPGDYEVVVVQIVITEDLAAADHQHGRTVPRRYADYYTSGLRFSNAVDRTGPIVIELTTDQ